MTSKLTITRERLEKIKSWRETYGAGSNVMLPAEEAEELARIVLAAMGSEPVVPDAATAIRACLSEFPESVRDIVEECADIAENACRAAMLQAGDAVRDLSTPVDPQVAEYEKNVMQADNSPVIPDGYVMVPKDVSPEQLRAFQLKTKIGAYVTANWSGAYDSLRELWDVAIAHHTKIKTLD